MNDPRISRRTLLRNGALLGGGLYVAGQLAFPKAAAAAAASNDPLVFTKAQWALVEAMTARLIPTDDQPGAREAGCVNFIDKALANEEAAARPLYEAALPGVDAVAKAMHAKSFAALEPAAQDAVLVALEKGTAKAWPAAAGPSPEFFETLRVHTVVGFLADPKYGGNRDFAGWRVAGYPGPRHRRGGYTPDQVTGKAPIDPIWKK